MFTNGDLTNCKNCGALLPSYPCKCEYCGTVYGNTMQNTMGLEYDAKDILAKFESGAITANEARRMIGMESLHDLERARMVLRTGLATKNEIVNQLLRKY